MLEVTNQNLVMSKITEHKLISILRGIEPKYILHTAQALYRGGIRLIEVTYNQNSTTGIEDTTQSISLIKKEFGDFFTIGAGTVMTEEQVIAAKNSGAEFVLSADTKEEIIELTKELGMISIPGAYTPTEIARAYGAGADCIKLFPASEMGASYIKAITAPLNHIPMIAVGGIDENNMFDFLKLGIRGIGLGSNLVNRSLVMEQNYSEITNRASLFTNQIKQYMSLVS